MLGTQFQMKNSIGGAILIRLLSDLLKEHLTKRNPIRDNILDISTRFVKDLQKVKPKLKERKTKQHDPISYQFRAVV